MRILLVNAFFPPRTTGSAHFSLDVARELTRAGHAVTVLTTHVDGAPHEETRDGMRIVRLPAWSINPRRLSFNYTLPFVSRPGAIRTVTRLVRDVAPDVIHQNGQFFDLTFLTTIAEPRRLGIPRVLTIHTPLVHTDPLSHRVLEAIERTVLRRATSADGAVVVGVDRTVCELAQERLAPRSPVRFIPATLRVDCFGRGDASRVRSTHGLGSDPVILSLGHVIPTRSRLPLIRALPALLDRHPDVKVLVVGGIHDDRFLRLAEALGVSHAVIAVGPVPHEQVPDYLAAATLDCHDLDGHTLGITTMEAMAAGVPTFAIVRRDVFPGVELGEWPALQVVESATPQEIARALCRLLESPDLRADVVREQRSFVERWFRAEHVARQYLDLYGEVTLAHPRPLHATVPSSGRAATS